MMQFSATVRYDGAKCVGACCQGFSVRREDLIYSSVLQILFDLELGFRVRLHIFSGWLFGGLIGGLSGFYGLLMLLAKWWPDMSYETSLSYLLIGAVVGLLAGGYAASRFLARRANL